MNCALVVGFGCKGELTPGPGADAWGTSDNNVGGDGGEPDGGNNAVDMDDTPTTPSDPRDDTLQPDLTDNDDPTDPPDVAVDVAPDLPLEDVPSPSSECPPDAPAAVSLAFRADVVAIGLGVDATPALEILDANGEPTCLEVTFEVDEPTVAVARGAAVRGIGLGSGTITVNSSAGALSDSAPLEVRFGWRDARPGYESSCALGYDGAMYCWGTNNNAQCAVDPAVSTVLTTPTRIDGVSPAAGSLTMGAKHGCLLDDEGQAWCWGKGYDGELGDGQSHQTPAVGPVSTDLRFKHIEGGFEVTCAIAMDDSLHCWGRNTSGQLGDGTLEPRNVPTPVVGGHRFKSVSLGQEHACGVTTEDALLCWGSNADGQLGQGDNVGRPSPVAVTLPADVVDVGVGEYFSCAVVDGGDAYCWGRDEQDKGCLGIGEYGGRLEPTLVTGGHRFVEIDGGFRHACGRTDGGAIWCWGGGTLGLRGDGTDYWSHNTPQPVDDLGVDYTSFNVTRKHTCAQTTVGLVYCWGENARSKLGVDPDPDGAAAFSPTYLKNP